MSWLKGRYDHGSEPRDRYGPMEIDEPDPLAKLNQYTIQDDSYGEGPSRKRKLTLYYPLADQLNSSCVLQTD